MNGAADQPTPDPATEAPCPVVTGSGGVVTSTGIGLPTARMPTAAIVGSTGSARDPVGGRMLTAAGAVGSGVATLVRPASGDGAASALGRGGTDIASPLAPPPREGWGKLPFSPSAPLVLGAMATILIGLILRRRAVRLAADASPESGYAEFSGTFMGVVGSAVAETRDGDTDHAAWELHAPPSS